MSDPKATQVVDHTLLILQSIENLSTKIGGIEVKVDRQSADVELLKHSLQSNADQLLVVERRISDHAELITRHADQIGSAREQARKAMESSSEIIVKQTDFQKAVMGHIAQHQAGIQKTVNQLVKSDEIQTAQLSSVMSMQMDAAGSLTRLTRWSQNPLFRIIGTMLGAAIASYLAARAH